MARPLAKIAASVVQWPLGSSVPRRFAPAWSRRGPAPAFRGGGGFPEPGGPVGRVRIVIAASGREPGPGGGWRGEGLKTLGVGVAFEVDAECLAHSGAAPVAADQIAARHLTT